ncbi:hypothetical protein J6590_026890 [Homalodisca vitripennis]|nr:hypothetical protein J6590_026890 [Homalodisca vitripennis]
MANQRQEIATGNKDASCSLDITVTVVLDVTNNRSVCRWKREDISPAISSREVSRIFQIESISRSQTGNYSCCSQVSTSSGVIESSEVAKNWEKDIGYFLSRSRFRTLPHWTLKVPEIPVRNALQQTYVIR